MGTGGPSGQADSDQQCCGLYTTLATAMVRKRDCIDVSLNATIGQIYIGKVSGWWTGEWVMDG
jgi:hypothetical protein